MLGAGSDAELGFRPTPRGRTSAPISDPASWASAPQQAETAVECPDGTIGALRRALLTGIPGPRRPYDTGDGTAQKQHVAAAFTAFQDGHYERAVAHATEAMYGLSPGSEPHVRALAHQIAAIMLTKASHADIAWVAAERGILAAEAADDARLRLSLLRTAAFAMAVAGHHGDALTSIAAAIDSFRSGMARSSASASVYGTILLTGAVLAAGHGEPRLAATYLDESQHAADAVGTDRNDLWTAFGPTNVAIHCANVAAALGDMDTVLSVGGGLDVGHLPVERQVRLHLDVARASLAVGKPEDALATLVRAETTAPSQVRNHRITKDVVNRLVATAPRRPGAALTRLGHLLGVPVS
ncbi:XRE family transcriptional regulator [Isoptericola sp. BMS4]|uniref:XRE family transcriptional regulator n=1 Tax=Isoptericola sp. BMS4 TaxID=2527875 RepID=UPI001423ED76|nr:XRE family transcriptional regulator [Isoptericola sp. BMS4]